ncbi:O-antigen ligase family protein [Ampullimonas aquatilis]|uniref:O-antigen ligase family protein n=1 Tax=Ampullimonas aquatilis TaxID=1341549 RepID=UPI003C718C4C
MYLIIFSIWPQFSAYKIPGVPALEPQRILYAALLIWLVILTFTNNVARELLVIRIKQGSIPIISLVFLYGTHIFVSLFGLTPLPSLFLAIRELITTALIFFVALVAIKNDGDFAKIFFTLSLATIVVSLMALVESVLKHNLFASWVPLSSDYALWATTDRIRDGTYRAQATFDNPLLLVDYLILLLPIVFYTAINDTHKIGRIVGFLASILLPLAIFRTGSRSGVLIFFIEIGLILILWIVRNLRFRRRPMLTYFLAITVALMACIATFGLNFAKNVIIGTSSEEMMSSSARLTMIRRAWEEISAGHLFGFGFGKAGSIIGIRTGEPGTWLYVLDNYFLTLLLDSGIVSLFAFLVFSSWMLYSNLYIALSKNDTKGAMASYLFSATIGFLSIKLISSQTQIFPIFFILAAGTLTLLTFKEMK